MEKFYAVKQGFKPGVYRSWEECQTQVSGYPGAKFQKFDCREDAEDYLEDEEFGSFSSFASRPSQSYTSGTQSHHNHISSQPRGGFGKTKKITYYAVQSGYQPGIYNTWSECQLQVSGYPGARFKKFFTREEAEDFVDGKEVSPQKATTAGKSSPGGPEAALTPRSTNIPGLVFKDDDTTKKSASKKAQRCSESLGAAVDYEPPTVIYTDGCCLDNGRENPRAGIGVYWGDGDPRNVSRRLRGYQTNSRAEIGAVIHALDQAKKQGIKSVLIKTDSKFLVDSVTQWMPQWKAKGWRLTGSGKRVQNRDDFQVLEEKMANMSISWEHVSAHAGIHGNEMADELAYKGSKMPYPDY